MRSTSPAQERTETTPPEGRLNMKISTRPCVGSVQPEFSILELLNSSKRGWNISEISRKLDTCAGYHSRSAGYIRQQGASRRLQLSTKMFGLGRKALNVTPLPDIALPRLRWLVQETGFTALVGILEKNQVVFVQKVEVPGIIRYLHRQVFRAALYRSGKVSGCFSDG